MRNPWKRALALGVTGIWLGVSLPAQGASGAGPYYAMPAWDQTVPVDARFVVLTNMRSEAVLDRETGLVWERAPTGLSAWNEAIGRCHERTTGGRPGWRLPEVHELTSLMEPGATEPKLPPGHPFLGVAAYLYWSANGVADDAAIAYAPDFRGGDPLIKVWTLGKHSGGFVWCVRGR